MKLKKYNSKKYRRGLVGLVLAIGVCLAIIGWGMLHLGFGARVNSAISVSGITAREAADAGLAKALYEMNSNFPDDPVTGIDVPPETLDNSNASYSYRIETFDSDHYEIISTGISGRETKKVHGITSMSTKDDYALLVLKQITLRANTFLDAYDSRLGEYGIELPDGSLNKGLPVKIGTTSIEPDMIELKAGSTVLGDVLVGYGGDVDVVIKEVAGGNPPITGLRYPLPYPIDIVQEGPPDIFDEPDPITIDISSSEMTIIAPAVYTKLDPYTVQAPSIDIHSASEQGRLIVVGHVAIHVVNDMTLGSSSEIFVGDPEDPSTWGLNSSLTIYLDGALEGKNSNGINNLTKIPSNFTIYGTGPDGLDWHIKNASDFYGIYDAPNANIYINEGVEIMGSVIGKSFDLDQLGQLHYDIALVDSSQSPTGYIIDRWWEEVVH